MAPELAELLKTLIRQGGFTPETYNQVLSLLAGAGWVGADPDHHDGTDGFLRIQ